MNPPPGHNPFEPPPVGSYGGPPGMAPTAPASSEAVAALVCGILAWSCFPLGIVAIWLGVRARRAARDSAGRVGGDNLALGGMIVGGIFLALWLLYFATIGVMVALSFAKR
ncbi:MAG TPA: DUF4190 domain-containing protein [Polyangiaceae bacterium]|nr:DUF4190 domain-containing protein [Polyangiaceae bacterium]